jgi:hypothetical protein
MVNIRAELNKLWAESPVLIVTAVLMLATFAGSVAGIFLDSRLITGMPAWLKPAKFGISTAIYCVSLAWVYRYIDIWRPRLRAVAWIVAVVFVVEIAIIDGQAARGVESHFNNTSAQDRSLYAVMGVLIVTQWLSSLVVLAALFKQKFENPAWGWALRLGMLTTVIGSGMGGMMVGPTHDQLQAMHAKQHVADIGGHTVGAPDGGPGLPGVGWSTEHGDLRIPHFLGMHGMQLIPLFAWWFARRRVPAVFIAAASYLALVAILAWQALKGGRRRRRSRCSPRRAGQPGTRPRMDIRHDCRQIIFDLQSVGADRLADSDLRREDEVGRRAGHRRDHPIAVRNPVCEPDHRPLGRVDRKLFDARRGRGAVSESLAAAGRLGSLPGVRSVHWKLAGPRFDEERDFPLDRDSLSGADVPVRTDRAGAVFSGAGFEDTLIADRFLATDARGFTPIK